MKKPEKPKFAVPDPSEYYLDRLGNLRRKDLEGAGTRREQRAERRKKRNTRRRELKSRGK